MKFWTPEWFERNDITSKEQRNAWEKYKAHLERLRGVVPDDLIELALLPGIDDGLIVSVRRDDAPFPTVTFTLRCGDYPSGYFDLVLRYDNAQLSPEHAQALAKLARATESTQVSPDLARHEIDVTENGQIEHRFLFHPSFPYNPAGYQWFAIRADTLAWEKVPQPNRDLSDIPDRFPGGPLLPRLSLQERIKRVDPTLVRRYVQKSGQ